MLFVVIRLIVLFLMLFLMELWLSCERCMRRIFVGCCVVVMMVVMSSVDMGR